MLIREMKLGDSASVTKTVTETDVYLFAGITGDLNPAHTNEVSASQTQFGGRDCPRHPGGRVYLRSAGHEAAGARHHLSGPGAEIHQAGLYRGHRHGDLYRPRTVSGKEYRQAGHRMHQPARRRGDQRRGYRHAAEGSIAYKVNWEPGAARCAPGSHAVLTSEAAYLTYHLRGFWPAPPHTQRYSLCPTKVP